MASKLLINGKAGSGKSSLIKNLKDTFVISRDGKTFSFAMPHMMVNSFYGMDILIHGGDVNVGGETVSVEGFFDKMEKYNKAVGKYPKRIVIDSASKIMQDIIDESNAKFSNFDVHSNIAKEVGKLTKFIQEDLIGNGIDVIILNHVMDSDKNGLVPVGQGKFKDKGGFYAEVDHAILIDNMKVYHRGSQNQARTTIDFLPDTQHVANFIDPSKSKKLKEGEYYYDLQNHLDLIDEQEVKNSEFCY